MTSMADGIDHDWLEQFKIEKIQSMFEINMIKQMYRPKIVMCSPQVLIISYRFVLKFMNILIP